MSEWLKEHAWKVCIRLKRIAGSNPAPSAKKSNAPSGIFCFVDELSLLKRVDGTKNECTQCSIAVFKAPPTAGTVKLIPPLPHIC